MFHNKVQETSQLSWLHLDHCHRIHITRRSYFVWFVLFCFNLNSYQVAVHVKLANKRPVQSQIFCPIIPLQAIVPASFQWETLARIAWIYIGTEGLWDPHRFRGKGIHLTSTSFHTFYSFPCASSWGFAYISSPRLHCTAFSTSLEFSPNKTGEKILLKTRNSSKEQWIDSFYAPPHSKSKVNSILLLILRKW